MVDFARRAGRASGLDRVLQADRGAVMSASLEQEQRATLLRILSADDSWAEVMEWLGERRKLNESLGGDDIFISYIVFQMLFIKLPVRLGEKQ